jgi:hypothetical protein
MVIRGNDWLEEESGWLEEENGWLEKHGWL